MKAIYKITNLINNKVYIGQSIAPEQRWKKHILYNNNAIGQALKKYGVENFSFEIIEWTYKYNEQEAYWIAYYNSYGSSGYNETRGGEGHHLLTINEVKHIQSLLQNTTTPLYQIAKEVGWSYDVVRRINQGQSYYNEKLTYPIRFTRRNKLDINDVLFIEEFLLDFSSNIQKAFEQLDYTRTIVYQINNGKHPLSDSTRCNYPIIPPGQGIIASKQEVQHIESLLLSTSLSYVKIAELVGRERELIGKINHGQHRYSSQLNFPLR